MTSSSEPREIHLLQVPLDVHARAAQWHADLMREFALITIGETDAAEDARVAIPARLQNVVGELRGKYAGLTAPGTEELEAAHRRGEASADVTYALPAEAAADIRHYAELLDEVDAYCRRGELLILAAPPEVAAFRRWILGEFARQLEGAEPTPWPAWSGSGAV